MALIGSLLPDRPAEQDAAPVPSESPSPRYTISGQQGTSPDRPLSTSTASSVPAPVPNAVFGQDVVTMFDLGSGFLLVAADNCQKFFEVQDVKDLQQSLQAAGDAANALNGVWTEIFETHIKQP